MAHDFLGTFNRSQFERFLAYAKSQLPLIDGRIQHLRAEVDRIGTVVFRYSKGVPQGYAADPQDSYLGKLLGTYEVLGGDPFIDLRVRLRNDPVFRVKGTENQGSQYMSNGEVIGAKGLSDAPTAELMRTARSWVNTTLDYRFGNLERKIRRAVDYSDELQNEIATLKTVQMAGSVVGSLEYVAAQVGQFIADQNYRAIYDDGGSDKFGFNVYAPFSSYDVGGDGSRETATAQRQNSGFVGPGSTGQS
jgi:hypothetical protein